MARMQQPSNEALSAAGPKSTASTLPRATWMRRRDTAGFAVRAVIAFAGLGVSACGAMQKAELDREVDRLCAIDGGVHIYEVVRLPKEDFGPDGDVYPQYRTRLFTGGRYGADYVGRMVSKVLVSGNPSMVRQNTMIIRKSDDKVLGEAIVYGRRGGDGPGLGEPSSHLCPKGPAYDFERQVFIPQEK